MADVSLSSCTVIWFMLVQTRLALWFLFLDMSIKYAVGLNRLVIIYIYVCVCVCVCVCVLSRQVLKYMHNMLTIFIQNFKKLRWHATNVKTTVSSILRGRILRNNSLYTRSTIVIYIQAIVKMPTHIRNINQTSEVCSITESNAV